MLTGLSLAVFATSSHAQTETVLYNFSGGSDGGVPNSNLVFDPSGNLYGATQYGSLGYRTLFELSPDGKGAGTNLFSTASPAGWRISRARDCIRSNALTHSQRAILHTQFRPSEGSGMHFS